jgi:hypothetical protein
MFISGVWSGKKKRRILLDKQSIVILPDLSRRCLVVDPDDHHLYVSLGCAAENILQAAAVLQGAFAVGFRKIGMTGFEPAAPSSRTKCATKLRYIP